MRFFVYRRETFKQRHELKFKLTAIEMTCAEFICSEAKRNIVI